MEKVTYTRKQMAIHWLSAILIVLIFALPYAREFFGGILGGGAKVFAIHKSLGMVVLILTLFRLFFIIKEGVPKIIPQHQKLQRIGSKAVQGLLYLLLLLMPISGLLLNSRPVDFLGLGLFAIPPLNMSESTRETATQAHIIGQYVMIALVLGHSLMALFHHYVLKDSTLKSMLGRR